MSGEKVSDEQMHELIKKLKKELKQELKQELKKELTTTSVHTDGNLNLEDNLKAWLNKHGYPLEMEVASIANRAGFHVSQSEYYIDQETQQPREIDLVLSKFGFFTDGIMRYKLFVECKSGGNPWLLFCESLTDQSDYRRNLKEVTHELEAIRSGAFSPAAHKAIVNFGFAKQVEKIYPLINSMGLLGYGMTVAFADGSDAPYKAMMGATKAVMDDLGKVGLINGENRVFSAPIIVIDAPLFAVTYSAEKSTFQLDPIESGQLLSKHVIGDRNFFGVHIVTKQALPEFLRKCKESADWWNTEFSIQKPQNQES